MTVSFPVRLDRVAIGSHQMQRDVRVVTYDPTVMSGRDVEEVTCLHDDFAAIFHQDSCLTLEHEVGRNWGWVAVVAAISILVYI